jgi:cell wall-associated NlpC family hydrolase
VKGIDAAIVKWPKIRDERELSPGDVVFWKPVPGRVLGFKCPGHWHVGISLGGDSTIDNDWWTCKPMKGSLEKACTTSRMHDGPRVEQRDRRTSC